MRKKSDIRPGTSDSMWIPSRKMAAKIAIGYAIVGGLWILFSGWLLHSTVRDSATTALIEEVKGSFFVSLTAVLIWLALDRYFGAIRQSAYLLRDSEERLRMAAQAAGFGTYRHNLVNREVYWSPEFKALFGMAPDAPCRVDEDLLPVGVHPDDLEGLKARVRDALDPTGDGDLNTEYRILLPDGSIRWVLVRGRVVFSGEGESRHPVLSTGILLNINERKLAEQAVAQSEERLRTLVENAPTGIFVQTSGRFAYLNQAAARMFGAASRSVMLDTPVLDRFHPDSAAKVRERIRVLAEARQSVPVAEEKCIRLDGTEFEGEFSAVPFVYDGQAGDLVFFHDITERKRLEAQLRQSQKLEAIGQLAGGVAHDFNNILAAIMMQLGLLQLEAQLDDAVRTALRDIDVEAQRAAALTRQLLMFSRRSVLAVKPVDLNAIVANLLKMLTRLIGEHIDLQFDGKSPLPMVEADSGMMEQVLMNLVVNARDAMPHGGRLTISTSPPDTARHPGFVCLCVSDTGIGMEEATLKRIFEPFFTTKEAGQGTGLGLATVHGIVAQHKGRVEVESAVGRGTTFRIFLPVLGRASAEPRQAPLSEALPHGTETVLLVEDDSSVRRLTAESLRKLGYRVHEAANGQEAIEVWEARGSEVDLLLTDVVMPEGIGGLELAERLHVLKPGLRTIIASGYSAEILQSGMPSRPRVVYLPKPYQTRELARVVRDCLDAEE